MKPLTDLLSSNEQPLPMQIEMTAEKSKLRSNYLSFSAQTKPALPELKSTVLRDVCIAISIVLVPFGLNNAMQGAYALAFVNLLFFISLVWNAWRLHHHESRHLSGGLILLAGTINIFCSIYQNGEIAIYWSYLASVCAFLLLERRLAAWFNTFFIILLLPLITYSSDVGTSFRVAGTLCLVAIVTYIFSSRLENRNRELLSRTEELEKANAAKSEFLANMSHEIRTPLTAIVGYTESLLDDDELQPANREQLETVAFNARHLSSLVDDILDLSKIEAGHLEVALEEIELAPILAKLVLTEEAVARRKGLDFVLSTQLPLPRYLNIDPTRLNQILFNLIGNAIKFTDSGSVELAIRYHHKTNTLAFRVIDSGVGVPRESRAQLFQQFSQADSSITRIYGGTGLGLHISQQLAGLLNGHIEYFPQSQGSVFQLSLQLESEPDEWVDDERCFREVRHAETKPQTQFAGHVLIVEDSSVNQLLISLLVEKFGLRTTVVSNGMEAVKQVRNHRFELILMDLQMPVMSGVDATRAIRAFNLQIPIIALSADVLRHRKDSDEMAGFSGQLAKPIDTELLHATFASFLPVAGAR
jgi:signal transduction histidine kinase/CheY-like chemotaxis protein